MLTRLPLHPLLFAAYAVLLLYSTNLDEVLPVDAGTPLVRSMLGAAVALGLFGLVYRNARRGAIVATALVVAYFGYGHVSDALASRGLSSRQQLELWLVLVVAAAVYAARARASLPRATTALNVAAIVLVGITLSSILPYEASRGARSHVSLTAAVSTPLTVGRKPDIYFIIFDRYGSDEAIESRFGIDNGPMYDWLRDQGFHVPRNSHANYRATDFSIAATMNMQFLDNLTRDIGSGSSDRTPAQSMIKEHAVGQFLKSQGYTYYQLGTWFEPTRSITIADETLTLDNTSEFESVLKDTTIVPAVEHELGITKAELTFRDRHREGTLFELRQLPRLATAPGPKFIFAHILLPHDPYVFRADGTPLPETEAKAGDEHDLYGNHLTFANTEIKELVGSLLNGPEESRPIVIIEGDEGPLACREVDCVSNTPSYLRIRLGNLIAMYLPGVDVELSDHFTSVNTFRLVFSEYFGADLPLLPDHSFTWPDNNHLYDFRDVTDELTDP